MTPKLITGSVIVVGLPDCLTAASTQEEEKWVTNKLDDWVLEGRIMTFGFCYQDLVP